MDSGKSKSGTGWVGWYVQLKEPMKDVNPKEMEGVHLEMWEVPRENGRVDKTTFWNTPYGKAEMRKTLISFGCPMSTPASEFIMENEMLRGMPCIVGIGYSEEVLSDDDKKAGKVPRRFMEVTEFIGDAKK